MSPTPVGSRFAAGASRAPPPAQAWSEFVASAKPCSSPRADHPVKSSGTLEHRADPIQRIEVRGSKLISEVVLEGRLRHEFDGDLTRKPSGVR